MMLRLNIRHQLPQTAIRTQRGKLDAAAMTPAQLHGNIEAAQSNQGATQPVTTIDDYPIRYTYGARKLNDLTREFGQKGIADVREATSRKAQENWERIDNDGKPGHNEIAQHAYNEMFSKYSATSVVEFELMPEAEITVTPSEVRGDPDSGNLTTEIETTPFPKLHYTAGGFETYMKNDGFIRRWITMDEYDIYA